MRKAPTKKTPPVTTPLTDQMLRNLELEQVDRTTLVPHAENARRGDVAKIAKSLRLNHMYAPLLVRKETREILKGNHTWEATGMVGMAKVHVLWITGLTDDEARDILIADNASSDASTYDQARLLQVLENRMKGGGSIEPMLFERKDVSELSKAIRAKNAKRRGTDPGAINPEVDNFGEIRPQLGDVWELGDHVLVCGDSRSVETYNEGLAGCPPETAIAMLWADPPYGVDYVGKTAESLTIQNDGEKDLGNLLDGIFAAVDKILPPGGPIYIAHAPGPNCIVFMNAYLRAGWFWHQNLTWVKQTFVMGHSDYHWQTEPVIYGWKKGAERKWYGGRKQSTAMFYDKPSRNGEHPTMKPVELVRFNIEMSTKEREWVVDPCGGSGTTLAACQLGGRCCLIIDIDPKYCEAIIRRWEAMMDATARLLRRRENGRLVVNEEVGLRE